jgi:hypothetical protein
MTVDDLVSELESIQVANGYRSDVVLPVSKVIIDPVKMTKGPKLFVVGVDESVPGVDSINSVFNCSVRFVIGGIVHSQSGTDKLYEDLCALAHDVEKCYAGFVLKYQSDGDNRWVVSKVTPPKMARAIPPGENVGWLFFEFSVTIFGVTL